MKLQPHHVNITICYDDHPTTQEVLANAANLLSSEGYEDAIVILRKPGEFHVEYTTCDDFKEPLVVPNILGMMSDALRENPIKRDG